MIDGNKAPAQLLDDIGLCYYDPKTEQLKEFDPSVFIAVSPYEYSVRRFYIAKPSGTIQGKVYRNLTVSVASSSTLVTQKIRIGPQEISRASDFVEHEENGSISIPLDMYPTGIIPVDIFTQCNSPVALEAPMEITLEVE